jgi:dipeptidyl aminopeptidase/acylaminoacyl peptidase
LMQDDVTDGVKAMVSQGLADARRVCIVGWSYGGYAALAGAAFTPDLYACAASVSGVSDLPLMLGMIKKKSGDDSDRFAYWEDHIGSPIDPEVVSKSPAKYAASIRAPILLVHGVNDTIVPIEQSDVMARALQTLGKPVQYVKLDGDDHGILRTATRTRMLSELEKFLATYLFADRYIPPQFCGFTQTRIACCEASMLSEFTIAISSSCSCVKHFVVSTRDPIDASLRQ